MELLEVVALGEKSKATSEQVSSVSSASASSANIASASASASASAWERTSLSLPHAYIDNGNDNHYKNKPETNRNKPNQLANDRMPPIAHPCVYSRVDCAICLPGSDGTAPTKHAGRSSYQQWY